MNWFPAFFFPEQLFRKGYLSAFVCNGIQAEYAWPVRFIFSYSG